AEFERELIAERTIAGLASGPAGRAQRAPPVNNKPPNQPLAMAPNGQPHKNLPDHWQQLCVTPPTQYTLYNKKKKTSPT
ncbi:hypothetical protein ACVGWJ_00200, partial [Enterobacter hormaechei]